MKNTYIFITAIVLLFVGVLLLESVLPMNFDWSENYDHASDQPFGCKLFDQVMEKSLPNGYMVDGRTQAEWSRIDTTRLTFIEVGGYVDCEYVETLLDRGDNVLIAAGLTSTCIDLGFDAVDSYTYLSSLRRNEAMPVKWCADGVTFPLNGAFVSGGGVSHDTTFTIIADYPRDGYGIHIGLEKDFQEKNKPNIYDDSVAIDDDYDEYVVPDDYDADDYDAEYLRQTLAVMKDYGKGKGRLVVVGCPYLFTNYAMRDTAMQILSMRFISLVAQYPVVRIDSSTRIYAGGDDEEYAEKVKYSSLRYFLSHAPLRWALYLLLFTIVAGMAFTVRRRQRVIPVIKPPVNYTMALVHHFGSLYFNRGDHHDLVCKKYMYFADTLRREVMVDVDDLDHLEGEVAILSAHTGIEAVLLRKLLDEVHMNVYGEHKLSARQMVRIIDMMNDIQSKI